MKVPAFVFVERGLFGFDGSSSFVSVCASPDALRLAALGAEADDGGRDDDCERVVGILSLVVRARPCLSIH